MRRMSELLAPAPRDRHIRGLRKDTLNKGIDESGSVPTSPCCCIHSGRRVASAWLTAITSTIKGGALLRWTSPSSKLELVPFNEPNVRRCSVCVACATNMGINSDLQSENPLLSPLPPPRGLHFDPLPTASAPQGTYRAFGERGWREKGQRLPLNTSCKNVNWYHLFRDDLSLK